MPHNLITLPRSELYNLVWSKPVRDIAAEFGISDVALAKRCRALKIPVPGRGHWARVAAGQKPRRPALPPFSVPRHGPRPDYVTTRASDGTVATEPIVTFDPQRTNAPIAVLDTDLPTVDATPHHALQDCSDLVKRTARHHKHPQRAELKFTRGEASGPILHLDVSPDTLDRALYPLTLPVGSHTLRFSTGMSDKGVVSTPSCQPDDLTFATIMGKFMLCVHNEDGRVRRDQPGEESVLLGQQPPTTDHESHVLINDNGTWLYPP